MKKVARSLRRHEELLLNWFRAKGEISAGIVEGFNNKAKLTIRKAYGFRTPEAIIPSPYIINFATSPSHNSPIDSGDEAVILALD